MDVLETRGLGLKQGRGLFFLIFTHGFFSSRSPCLASPSRRLRDSLIPSHGGFALVFGDFRILDEEKHEIRNGRRTKDEEEEKR